MKFTLFIGLLILLLTEMLSAQTNDVSDTATDDSVNPKYNSPHFINIIGGSRLFGKHRKGYGFNYSGFKYDSSKNVFIDVTFGYDQVSAETNVENNSRSYKLHSGYTGFHVYPRIYDELFLKLGLLFHVGEEVQKYDLEIPPLISNEIEMEDKYFTLGVTTSQGVTYIPTTSAGLAFSLSFYQRVHSLEDYKYDIGAILNIGIRF